MEDKIDKNQTSKNNIKKETETLKFEDNLWDLYEGLHERYRRQYNYLSNLKTVFTKYKSALIDFSKNSNASPCFNIFEIKANKASF